MRRVLLVGIFLIFSTSLLLVTGVRPCRGVSFSKPPERRGLHVKMIQLAPRLSMSEAMMLPRGEILYQRGPAIAYGEGTYLIVWQEGYGGLGGSSDILGMRLDEEGQWLDEKPIAICKHKAVQDTPAVAYCGGEFLVAWSDFRSGCDYDVYATLVGPSGRVKTPDGFLLSGGKGGRACPAVASNGKNTFFVVWQDRRGGKRFEIYGARVACDSGKVLDKEDMLVLSPGEKPAVAYTGENYFVSLGRYGSLVSEDGKTVSERMELWSRRRSLHATATSAWGKAFAFHNTAHYPDPWGWGGNGAITGISITPEGHSPERGLAQEVRGFSFTSAQAEGAIKNCVDAARWRNHNGWPMGMYGGFKGTHENTWPSGQVAAAYNGRSLLVVWNRANFVDELRIGNRDLYLKRILDNWAYVDEPKLKIVAGATEEVFPVLAAGAPGNALLAYERQEAEGGIGIEYRLIREEEDRQPPRIAHILKESDEKMSVVFDEPVERESASKVENYSIEGVRIKSVEFNEDNASLEREVMLETESQTPGETYVLRVRGVTDLSSNRNATRGEAFKYLCKPGKAQRSDFIERWAIVGRFPRNWKVNYIDPATVHPSPGDELQALSSDRVKQILREVIDEDDWAKGNWDIDADKYFGGEKQWQVAESSRTYFLSGQRPNVVTSDYGSVLKLMDYYGRTPMGCAFANTYVFCEKEREVLVRIDVNYGQRAWLNGELISSDDGSGRRGHGLHDYTNEAPVKLKEGWNQLLIQVDNIGGRWAMVAQITDKNKQPIRDLTYQLENPFK